jgi:hypothetical protein
VALPIFKVHDLNAYGLLVFLSFLALQARLPDEEAARPSFINTFFGPLGSPQKSLARGNFFFALYFA